MKNSHQWQSRGSGEHAKSSCQLASHKKWKRITSIETVIEKEIKTSSKKRPSCRMEENILKATQDISRILRELKECHSQIISTDNQIDETFVSGKHENILQIHFKRSALLIITETQIKTAWRHQLS